MEDTIRLEKTPRGFRVFIDIGREIWVIHLEKMTEEEARREAEEIVRTKKAA